MKNRITYVEVEGDELVETEVSQLRVLQPRNGWKFSDDSVELAYFCAENEIKWMKKKTRRTEEMRKIVDVGIGSGVIALLLSRELELQGVPHTIFGVDIDKKMVKIAKLNSLRNQIPIHIISADIRKPPFAPGSFDVIVSNPPYIPPTEGKISQKYDIAKWEIQLDLRTFASASSYLLKPKGHLYTVYPSFRLGEVLSVFYKAGLQPTKIRFFHHSADFPSDFFLLFCVKGAKHKLEVLPPKFKVRA